MIVLPEINDEILRTYDNGDTFTGVVIDKDDSAIKVSGTGYIGGEHYDDWSGWLSSLDGVEVVRK